MPLPFLKAHGLGNDFVMLDSRQQQIMLTDDAVRNIADRRLGVGCDQLIILRPSDKADLFMEIRNADGSEVAACGNATRCAGWLYMEEFGQDICRIETRAGLLETMRAGDHHVTVSMGIPRLMWQEIPLQQEADTLHLPLAYGSVKDAVGVNMGNPHAIFFIAEHVAQAPSLAEAGPVLERDALFPERANISMARMEGRAAIHLQVWERGAGLTHACGTAACAALVAARRRGLADEQAMIHLPGGELTIAWDEPKGTLEAPTRPVMMTGPVAMSFTGMLSDDLLEGFNFS